MASDPNKQRVQKRLGLIINALQISLFLSLCLLIAKTRKLPYADDWSYVKPLQMHSQAEFLSWLFSQHVDHRIPVQKMLHLAVAQISGFDMRALMAVNAFLALLSSAALVKTASIYRSRRSPGDLAIPLIILTPAAGYSLWAFQLQFLSCIVLVSLAVLHWCKQESEGRDSDFVIASLCMIALPLCGLNGAIFSTVMSTGVLTFLIGKHCFGKPVKPLFIWMTASAITSNALVWLTWKPSHATTFEPSLTHALESSWKLLGASLFAVATDKPLVASSLVLILSLGGCLAIGHRAATRGLLFSDLVITLTILSSLAIIAAVSVGRAPTQDLIFHYGNLTPLLPIMSWLAVSRSLTGKASLLAGCLIAAPFAMTYGLNLKWRTEIIASQAKVERQIEHDLHHNTDTAEIVTQFGNALISSNPNIVARNEHRIASRILTLRKRRYPLYSLTNTPRNMP